MSEHEMNAPQGWEQFRYAELVAYLPPDWPMTREAFEKEENYWPIRCLKTVARFPHWHKTWITIGHTILNANEGAPASYAPNTELCCALMCPVTLPNGELARFTLDDGSCIDFLQVVPIYNSEMEYKLKHGFEALLQKLSDQGSLSVIDPHRPSCCP
ncbi:MAG TPA: suppressor of fused domain protein [Blastocatellia bacterium]|nr:suppressor of fused domain protein [Blastocatellia bacterium]